MENNKSKANHGLKKMLLMGAASAIAGQVMKPIIEKGLNIVKTKLLYMISIDNCMGGIGNVFKEVFRNFPDSVEFNVGESDYVSESVKIEGQGWNFYADYVDFTFFQGTPIMIIINKFSSDGHGCSHPNGAWLVTFNSKWNRHMMKKFLQHLNKLRREDWINNFYERDYNVKKIEIEGDQGNIHWLQHKLRTFDDVFMPSKQKKYLIDSLEAYVQNRNFYVNNNIPNHFGVLLYGDAGTGKSSIAQAITHHIGGELTVISGDHIKHIEEIIDTMGTHSMDDNIYRVLLFEDIDSGLFNLTREKTKKDDDKTDDVGMATILNALDGIGAPTNVIYVFTTNHAEVLDPAFIRPGRCDIHLEIKGVTQETLKDFIEFHYDISDAAPLIEKLNKGHCITPGLTFAKLQTLVMEGQSAEDVIEFAYGF